MSYKITHRCIGCTACKISCPVGAITGEPREQHTINKKRCVECGVCGGICQHSAVEDQFGHRLPKISRDQRARPSIDALACSACGICVNICTFGCIAISAPIVKGDKDVFAQLINPSSCVGCGLCQKSCPIAAIIMVEGGV